MTETIYIKFAWAPETPEAMKKKKWRFKILSTILFFIPRANPEYEDLLDNVGEWQLEIDPTDNLPIREIGVDMNGKTIFIMPWRNNYGFWTDNNITLEYFKNHFKAERMNKVEFDQNWDNFAKLYPDLS